MPQKNFKLPIDNLKTLAANSAKWQEVTGALDANAAKAFIDEGSSTKSRPRMIVGSAGSRSLKKGNTTGWNADGALAMQIEIATPAIHKNDHNASWAWFMDIVDTIIDEMAELAGQNGFLNVTEFTEDLPAIPVEEEFDDEGEEFWVTIFDVEVDG